jgi:hypothetical protein
MPPSPLLPTAGDRPPTLLLCATVGRSPSRDDRLPLRESAPLVAAMALTLWALILTLAWSVTG